ncbi:MAG TPA: VCBS repeat-containing protein, partial [Gemmataceae bacterium]
RMPNRWPPRRKVNKCVPRQGARFPFGLVAMSGKLLHVLLRFGAAAAVVGGIAFGYSRLADRPPGPEPEARGNDNPLSNLSLSPAEREYLWEIEHHGNALSQIGFKALAEALSANDAGKVAAVLSGSFAGHVPTQTRDVELDEGYVRVARRTAAGGEFRTLGRDEFVAELMSYRGMFAKPPRVKFALVKLFPHERGQLDGPWDGRCLLEMRGEWQEGRPAEVVLTLDFRSDRPTKERVGQEGWLHAVTLRQSQVGRADRFLFRDVTAASGIDTFWLHDNWKTANVEAHTGGVYLCDFDRDGRLDVLVTERHRGFLYRGLEGGKFREVTSEAGLTFPLQEWSPPVAAWIDIDGDGWEDLLHGTRVWRNEAGRGFADYSGRCNLRFPPGAVSAAVADYDRDGRLDLYLTYGGPGKADSWLSGKAGSAQRNLLFRNLGGWKFADVSEASGAGVGDLSTFTAVWLDVNNDGWPDLHAIHEFGDGVLLVNRGDGTFGRRRLSDRPVDFGSMGAAAGDIDNDGNIDLYLASMYSKAGKRIFGNLREDTYPPDVMARIHTFVKGNELHRNLGGLKFANLGEELQVAGAGWAYGTALEDFNNDGWLDIHSTAGFISRSRDEPDG